MAKETQLSQKSIEKDAQKTSLIVVHEKKSITKERPVKANDEPKKKTKLGHQTMELRGKESQGKNSKKEIKVQELKHNKAHETGKK
jgi:hypothetical protein